MRGILKSAANILYAFTTKLSASLHSTAFPDTLRSQPIGHGNLSLMSFISSASVIGIG